MIPPFAHGILGPYDEIVFAGIAVVFVGMMGVSWLRSRQIEDDDETQAEQPKRDDDNFELN